MIESTSDQTVGQLLESAIMVENKAGDLFGALSRLFSHVSDVSVFWKELSDDERDHARALQDIRASLTQDQLSLPCESQVWENMLKIQRLLSKDLIARIQNLDDAYELAHELEFSEVNTIFKFLASEFIPHEKHRAFVMSEITKHQNKLVDFARSFGDRAWRKQISTQGS